MGGEPAYLHRLEITTTITLVLSIVVALSTGIYIVIKMNRTKQQDTRTSGSDILSP